jgi:thiamine transport system permease protein
VLIFLLCASSFVIVLTLGGGPQFATLEVAIFQALRMDFDLARALSLALVQLAICIVLIALLHQFSAPLDAPHSLRRSQKLELPNSRFSAVFETLAIALGLAVILPPFVALLVNGIGQITFGDRLLRSTLTSIGIGCSSTALATLLAVGLATVNRPPWVQPIAMLGLIIPPAVIATGWFIATLGFDVKMSGTAALIIALNALMALPFSYSVLVPALARHRLETSKLVGQLGMSGWARMKHVDFPQLRRPILQALLLGFIMSLGDLTAVLLLGNNGIETLPALLHAQMGNYRFGAADGTAFVLATLCFALAYGSDRLGTRA